MKFFADEMLGKLARWLRMAGLDVQYERKIQDSKLIAGAQAEKRIVLTRDSHLIKEMITGDFLYIDQDRLEDQLKQFYARYPQLLRELHPLSRCVECNTALLAIEKEKIKDRVWPYVYETQEHFTTCPRCDKIFWEATHVKRIREKLEQLMPVKKEFPSHSSPVR